MGSNTWPHTRVHLGRISGRKKRYVGLRWASFQHGLQPTSAWRKAWSRSDVFSSRFPTEGTCGKHPMLTVNMVPKRVVLHAKDSVSRSRNFTRLSKSHQQFMSRAGVIARQPRESGSLIQSTLVPPASTPELFSSATKRMTEWRHRYRTWLLQQVQGSSRIFQVAATPNTIAVRPDDNVLARCA